MNFIIELHAQAKKGFLLFEVLIAVVILSVGIVFSMRAFHHVLMISQRSADIFYVERAAEDLLIKARNGLEAGDGFPLAGKVDALFDAEYEIKKVRLTVPDDDTTTEMPDLVLPNFKYYLATLTLKKAETVLIELPFVVRESEGQDAI